MTDTPETAHNPAPPSETPQPHTDSTDAADRKRRPIRRWLYELATDLTGPVHDRDRATTRIDAIRAYHRELARLAELARHDDVRAGWWSGPPPYGYRIVRRRLRDHSGRLRTRRLLAVDEARAPIVPTIYHWYTDERLTPAAIAARLATDPDRYPAPIDHTTEQPRPWTRSIVTGILRCPDYTGYVVRGRTHHGTEQPVANWTWSIGPSHPPLINATQFRAAYNRRQQARQQRGRAR